MEMLVLFSVIVILSGIMLAMWLVYLLVREGIETLRGNRETSLVRNRMKEFHEKGYTYTPWTPPYTDEEMRKFREQNIRKFRE